MSLVSSLMSTVVIGVVSIALSSAIVLPSLSRSFAPAPVKPSKSEVFTKKEIAIFLPASIDKVLSSFALLLAKNVDGVYDSDPKTNPNAKKYDSITYMDVIAKGLKATDTTAITMCMENNIPVIAFSLMEEGAMIKAVKGEKVGTFVGN